MAELMPDKRLAALVQVGADALRAHVRGFMGAEAKAALPGGPLSGFARPVVTAVWEVLGAELTDAQRRRDQAENRAALFRQQVADLKAERDRLTDPKAMADAIVAHLHPPHEWPDGPPCEGEHERAYEEAEAIIAALTGEEDDDAD